MWYRFIKGDALNLPFQDDTLDGLTLGYGLRNVVDIDRALQEMYRCLKYSKDTGP